MKPEYSHTVTVTVEGRIGDFPATKSTVTINGDGDLEHMLHTFRSALVAAGFTARTAESLELKEE